MRTPMDDAGLGELPAMGDSQMAVELAWGVLRRSLEKRARRITLDEDHQNDLIQDAMIKLWNLDPTRFDLRRRKERTYLRRLLGNRMLAVWGRRQRDYGPMTEAYQRAIFAQLQER